MAIRVKFTTCGMMLKTMTEKYPNNGTDRTPDEPSNRAEEAVSWDKEDMLILGALTLDSDLPSISSRILITLVNHFRHISTMSITVTD